MARRILLVLMCACVLPAATLQRLSLNDLIAQSSSIVRGQVSSSGAAFRGSVIYTHWKVLVAEQWKGAPRSTVEFMLPGGAAGGFRQSVPGAPALVPGKEYLLFLWTSRTGSVYITGLSQGVFDLSSSAADELMATRPAADETMLDPKSWQPVKDEPVAMRFSDMSALISAIVAKGGSN